MNASIILLASSFSYRFAAFEQAAARLGVKVIRGEDVPPPMLEKVNLPLALDYRDLSRSADLLVAYGRKYPLKAILALDDSGVLLAAMACQRLGLPYNDPQAARAARDKHLMRQRFAEAGVPSPTFRHYSLADDPTQIAAHTHYPCVLKPTALSGSRGVMRADNPSEFLSRYQSLRRLLTAQQCDEFLVEDFIPGVEVALEGLMDDGQLHPLALFDKPDPLNGPYFEETIYVTPSRLPAESQQAIIEVATHAARALGLRHGPVHAELRLNEDGPWMLEIAARSIGGECSRTLRFDGDHSLEELILRQALGMDFRLPPTGKASGVMMIPIPASGILRAVAGVEDARQVPLVEEVTISARLHHPLKTLPEGDSYLGFIFARGEHPAAVENALREAHSKLRFEITPEVPLLAVHHI